jgi:hypothetical protein
MKEALCVVIGEGHQYPCSVFGWTEQFMSRSLRSGCPQLHLIPPSSGLLHSLSSACAQTFARIGLTESE